MNAHKDYSIIEPPQLDEMALLRRPPQSKDAEESLIGGLLINARYMDDIADIVQPSDFFGRPTKTVFTAITKLHEAGDAIDVITVAEAIENIDSIGGIAYLADMAQNTPSTANLTGYAKLVRDRALERQLCQAGMQITDLGFDTSIGLEEKLGEAQKAVMSIGESTEEATMIDTNSALQQWVSIVDDRFNGNAPTGLMTGFRDIDKRTNGLQKSDFILLAARPSMGKTTLALNIAEHVAVDNQKPVLIFSMEMGAMQLWDKIGSSLSGIPLDTIRRGTLGGEDWPMLSGAVSKAKDSPLYIDDRGELNINQIKATARRLHRKNPLSLIIVDYLQLAKARADSREREIGSISAGLKGLAKELDIPVIALSQLNRDLEKRPDKRPKNSDLRDSGSLEQDADLIFFIYRDEVYNEESPEKGIAEIICSKFRNGQIGTDRLHSRLDVSKFADLSFGYEPPEVPDRKTQATGLDY